MLNAVQLPKPTERCTNLNKLLDAVQLPKQSTERCTTTEANYWTLYNYRNKLPNAVQLPKQITQRCTIT